MVQKRKEVKTQRMLPQKLWSVAVRNPKVRFPARSQDKRINPARGSAQFESRQGALHLGWRRVAWSALAELALAMPQPSVSARRSEFLLSGRGLTVARRLSSTPLPAVRS